MSEISKIVADFESIFSESNYPPKFLDTYDQMECLANHRGRETFLVRRKADGVYAVAKCFDRKAFPLKPGTFILCGIEAEGLPKYYEEFSNDRMLCLVREYIEGTPLNIYAKEKTLSQAEILSIAGQVCDILDILHSHKPPIIHRDIKPENIIVRPDGRIVLIDFDIARTVSAEAEADSVIFGTRGYAPPEQYGFEQTDRRADIFSFGILLRWLMTGSIRTNPNIRIDPAIQKTIDRCTAFSPEDRFDDIQQVKASLMTAGKSRIRVPKRTLISLFVGAVLLLGLGFLIGRFTGFLRIPQKEPPIAFTEPLIEKAVRLQLGVDENTVLTAEDLSRIRRLYIYGMEVYADQELYYKQDLMFHRRGTVHSLYDLEKLPNLEMFFMTFQGQVDISAVSGLENLTYIELKHMKLENIYPLGDLPMLRQAILFDTNLSDVTALEACHWLDTLDIGANPIPSMEQIGHHPFVQSLSLRKMKMETLDGIEGFPSLQGLTLIDAEIGDLSAVTRLPKLQQVYISPDLTEDVTAVLNSSDVEIITGN